MTWFDFGLFSSDQVQFTAPSELHQRVACAPFNHFQFNKAKPTHLCRFGLVAVMEINEYYSISSSAYQNTAPGKCRTPSGGVYVLGERALLLGALSCVWWA